MPITTHTEYLEAKLLVERARTAAQLGVRNFLRACVDGLDNVDDAAEIEACRAEGRRRFDAIDAEFDPQLAALEREAREALVLLDRLVISWQDLEAAAHASWPGELVMTVSNFADLRREFEQDRLTHQLLLMVRYDSGALALDNERRPIPDLVTDLEATAKLRAPVKVFLQGELTGRPPGDIIPLRRLLQADEIEASWTAAAIPTAEIQVNRTSTTNDDRVLLSCKHPRQTTALDCRIRLTSNETGPVTVVLTDPSDKIRFPGRGDQTKQVALPANHSWVDFQISGRALGEATITAHIGNTAGAACGARQVTVVGFQRPRIEVSQGGNYKIVANIYTVPNGSAVTIEASAGSPTGISCRAPVLANVRVGIMQEVLDFEYTLTWDSPRVTWKKEPLVPKEATIVVPSTMRLTTTFDPSVRKPVNDGTPASAFPLYDRRPAAVAGLMGCPNGRTTLSEDTPNFNAPGTFDLPFSVAGVLAGEITWGNRLNATLRLKFRTYSVVFDAIANTHCALRQADWQIDVDSSAPNPQHATIATGPSGLTDRPASRNPALGQQANNAPLSSLTAGVGPDTKAFTKNRTD